MADIMKGITGGITGGATGGPVGAILGGIGGLFGGGGNESSQTQNSSSTSTTGVNARDWTGQEQGALDNAFGSMANANMTPEQAAAMEHDIYGNLFGAGKQQIDNTYNQGAAQNYSQAARRGGGNTSRTGELDRTNLKSKANDTANLSAQSQLQAQQMRQQEEANMRANSQVALQQLNSLWQNRLASSSVTTTTDSVGGGSYSGPDTFYQDAASSLGGVAADGGFDGVNDWMSGLFGGGDSGSNVTQGYGVGPYSGVGDMLSGVIEGM